MRLLLKILEDEGSIEIVPSRQSFAFTARGILLLDELKSSGGELVQGFVAMSFNKEMDEAYFKGFGPGIRAAGFQPVRIDGKEYVGGISDRIMVEIRASRFVVADYTLQNNGVYFEAGFALGLGRVIIPTCRKDHVDKLHFDIKHLNTLLWESSGDLADALGKRIVAILGRGPLLTNE